MVAVDVCMQQNVEEGFEKGLLVRRSNRAEIGGEA
jgi:hypothetical protein